MFNRGKCTQLFPAARHNPAQVYYCAISPPVVDRGELLLWHSSNDRAVLSATAAAPERMDQMMRQPRVWGAYRDADGDGRLPWGHDPSLVDSFHLESVGGPHAHGCQVLKVQGLQHSQLPGDGVQREQLSGRLSLDPVCDIGKKVCVHRLSGGARPRWGGRLG